MLTALTDEQKFFQLSMYAERDYLREIRKKQLFFCPACNERVVLKVGEVIVPHFAHIKNQSCDVFSEGETRAHLKGKHLLYNWYKKQSQPVLLEPYIRVIRQRPDLLLKQRQKYVAIEFQCSPIQSTYIRRRTKGYNRLNMDVLWIGLAKKTMFNGLQKIKLSPFHQLFVRQQLLILLDVEKRYFNLIKPLLHVSGMQFISFTKKLRLTDVEYPLLKIEDEEIDVEHLVTLWFEERQRYLLNRVRFNKRGIQDPFFQCCYINKIALMDLPNWIGLPTKSHGKSHAVEWQLIVVMLLKTVDIDDVYEEFRKRYRTYNIPIEAVEGYLRFIKRYNPTLKWADLKNHSISEEIITQFVALKFDN